METKLPKMKYSAASVLKDILLFSVWFGIFFFVMLVGTGSYSFSLKSQVVSPVSDTKVFSQKEVTFKNPKIVEFEKVNAKNLISSSEIKTVTPSPTPVTTPLRENNRLVAIKEIKTPSVSPVLPEVQSAKKTPVSSATIARRKYVAGDILPTRIVISKIGIDTGIENPEWNDIPTLTEALKIGAVRYPQSGLLGENSNILLFGHSAHLKVIYNKAYKAFNDLGDLVLGDEIKVYSNQKVYTYKVETVDLVKNTEEKVDLISSTPKLTLVTCNNFGEREDRFIVVAKLVGVVSLS